MKIRNRWRRQDLFSRLDANPFRRVFALSAAAILSVAILVGFAGIIWALPKGFDWTDEAWAYSLIASNRITVSEPWGFQYLLHPVFVAFGNSVLMFRVLRFLSYVALGAGLAFAFEKFARSRGWTLSKISRVIVYVAAQFGTLIAFSYPPRYVSYNELAAWNAQLFVIFAVLLFAQLWQREYQTRLNLAEKVLWAAIGITVVILIFAKFTSAIVIGLLAFLCLIAFSGPPRLIVSRFLATIAGGSVAWLCIWAAGFPINIYFQNLYSVFTDTGVQDANGHPVSGLIQFYLDSGIEIFISIWPMLFAVLGIFLVGYLRQHFGGKFTSLFRIATIALAGLFCWSIFALSRQNNATLIGELMAVLVVVLVLLLLESLRNTSLFPRSNTEPKRKSVQLIVFVAVILLAPIGAVIGTNNVIFSQLVFASTTWVTFSVGLLLLVIQRLEKTETYSTIVGLQVLFIAMGTIVLLSLSFELTSKPYRIPQYSTQHARTQAHFLQGLSLTQDQADWSNWLSRVADDAGAAGVATVAIDTPGTLLVFNNSPFASPWIASPSSISMDSITAGCDALQGRPSDFFVLQDGKVGVYDQSTRDVQSKLRACQLNFPEDFQVVKQEFSAVRPDSMTTVWRLKSSTG